MKPSITTHTIVKNEDIWIWYAIMSVIDQIDQMLIFDTGSIDQTQEIIKSIKSPKIKYFSKKATTRSDIAKLRQEQIKLTSTQWFMLLDGDEIWPQNNLKKLINRAAKAKPSTLAFFHYTRNCVGDVFHFLPSSKGQYQIKGKTGHLNIRLIRNKPGLKVKGKYPLEAYTLNNQPIQNLEKNIQFVNTWYLHTTHLPRSTSKQASKVTLDRALKQKFRLGQKMTKAELPQVLWRQRPKIVPAPITHRFKSLFHL